MKDNKVTERLSRRAAIDWSAVYRRLEGARAAVERGTTPTAEERKQILRARARALAQEGKTESPTEESLEVVLLQLAYEKYAIETSYVREVYPLKKFTPLPGTPPLVLGIVNTRGQLLLVIDIKKVFDLPEKGLTDLNKVVIVHTEAMEFGILADVILGVGSILLKDIQPSLPTLTNIRAEYLRGVTSDGVVVLDVAKILSDEKIVLHKETET